MAYVPGNFAFGTIAAGGLSNVATTLTLTAGHGARFPTVSGSDVTYLVVQDVAGTAFEVLKVTAHGAGSDSFTLTGRGSQEGTAAQTWAAGSLVGLRLTAATAVTVEGTQTLKNKDVEAARVDVASASTCNIGAAASMHVRITGTTTINSFGTGTPGKVRFLEFQSALSLGMTGLVPSLDNLIGVGAGDRAIAIADPSGNFYIHSYLRRSGRMPNGGAIPIKSRQCMAQGPATILQASWLGGLNVDTADFSTTNLIVTFGGGFDSAGEINYFGKNVTAGGVSGSTVAVTNSATNYIYASLADTTALAIGFGATTLKPIYQFGGTISVVNGQHTFDIRANKMYVGNGASATQVYRVFIGEADAAGGVVTAVRSYAVGDRYVSAETAIPAAGTATTFTHNLGADPKFYECKCKLVCQTAEFTYAIGDVIDAVGTTTGGINPQPLVTAYDRASGFFGYDDLIQARTRGSPGTINTLTAANWKFVADIHRGW